MKNLVKILYFIPAILTVKTSLAQDVLTFRNGKQVEAKIIEVTQTEIKYKKFHNPDGPLYTISQQQVQTIKYACGEVENYGDITVCTNATSTTIEPQQSKPQFIEPIPDATNGKIISEVNRPALQYRMKKIGNRASSPITVKYNITNDSVVSTADAEVEFQSVESVTNTYNMLIKNKSQSVLYVDLANSFRVDSNGKSKSLYNGEVTTVSTSSSQGASLGLGAITNALGIGGLVGTLANGLTVGGGNSDNMTRTYQMQQILVIPSKGSEYVSKYVSDRGYAVSKGESIAPGNLSTITRVGDDGKMKVICVRLLRNEEKVFSSEESPYYIDYLITYSSDSEFKTYSTLKFRLYISQAFGNHNYEIIGGKLMSFCYNE